MEKIKNAIPLSVIVSLAIYLIGPHIGLPSGQVQTILLLVVLIGAVPLAVEIVINLIKGHFGVDIIAIASVSGSILLGEYVTAAIILLMLSGGEFLENYALKRSRKELKGLLDRSPKTAHIKTRTGISDKQVENVQIGEIFIVKPGEIVPIDGQVVAGKASLDESSLSGESIPLAKVPGTTVFSGTLNIDGVLEVAAIRLSSQSRYQQLIELIKRAENDKAPFVRLADRYSIWFTALSFGIAALAWALSGDPVRGLTVLVVATPCPLILATPIAFASGISKATSLGLILKSGGIMEKLAVAKAFVFDKTGTLTMGKPRLMEVTTHSQFTEDEILRISASLDQLSQHVVARAITGSAQDRKLSLVYPSEFREEFGDGVKGTILGETYWLGKQSYVEKNINTDINSEQTTQTESQMKVYLASKSGVLGELMLKDVARTDVKSLFVELDQLGVTKTLMLTGDKSDIAKEIAQTVGIDDLVAEADPEQKVDEIVSLRKSGYVPVIMVGDGINDAPALATADVGIAISNSSNTATTETSDVVLVNDKIGNIADLLRLSRRVLSIAKQGIFIGIALSTVLMVVGAFGLFTPVIGALAQEVIDIIVILNALRVGIPQKNV